MKSNFFLKSWNFSGQFKQHFQQKLWKFSEMGSGTRSLSALANQKLRPVKVAKTIFCTFCEFSMSNVRVKIIYELKYTSDYIEIYKCAMGYSSLYPKLKRALKKKINTPQCIDSCLHIDWYQAWSPKNLCFMVRYHKWRIWIIEHLEYEKFFFKISYFHFNYLRQFP